MLPSSDYPGKLHWLTFQLLPEAMAVWRIAVTPAPTIATSAITAGAIRPAARHRRGVSVRYRYLGGIAEL